MQVHWVEIFHNKGIYSNVLAMSMSINIRARKRRKR